MVPLYDDEGPVLDDYGKQVEILGCKPLYGGEMKLDSGNFTIHLLE